jgi:hypothetical protein
MHIEQGQTAVLGNPVQLLEPDIGMALLQEQEQGGILRESVGEFDVATARIGDR